MNPRPLAEMLEREAVIYPASQFKGKKAIVILDAEAAKRIGKRKLVATGNKHNRIINVHVELDRITKQCLGPFLIGTREGFVVDHINRNKLDNRLSNLRHVTPRENARNRSARAGHILRGIAWYATKERYCAAITIDGKNIHLGYWRSDIEAAVAYDLAAYVHFGEYGNPNFSREFGRELANKIKALSSLRDKLESK